MKYRICHVVSMAVVLLAVGVLPLSSAVGQATEDLPGFSQSLVDLSTKVSPCVVRIVTTGFDVVGGRSGTAQYGKKQSGGSGVIVAPNGFIVTNAHVVAGSNRIQVVLPVSSAEDSPGRSILKGEGKIVGAQLIGLDTETDLAVLKVYQENLPFLEFGDSDLLRSGELVLAFGSPLGLENSVTMGVVSATARQLSDEDPMIYIQTDASINPGNSGGPLVNTKGEVIGINSFILSQSGGNEGLGFAAPSNIVKNVYNQFKSYGSVQRGEIGVHVQTITPVMADGMGLPQSWGVIVGDVTPGSPAEKRGLMIGDVVLTLDGKVMENARQFDVNIYGRKGGEPVSLKVLTGDREHVVQVPVVIRPDDIDRLVRRAASEHNRLPRLGIMAVEMDSDIRKLMPSTRRSKGVVVAGLTADAVFWGDRPHPGDIIYRINGQPVEDLAGLKSAVEPLRTGSPVVLQIERRGQLRYLAFEIQ